MVSLAEIGNWRKKKPHATHEEIASKFEKWTETNLGYSLDDGTLRLTETKQSGIPDLQGKDDNSKTIIVFELKKASDEIQRVANRTRIENDQLTRYLRDNSIDPAYLVLTDGISLYFYENIDRKLVPNKSLWIADLSLEEGVIEQSIIQFTKKPKTDYINKEKMRQYIDFLRKHPQHLDTKEGIEFFASKFALNRNTSFGKLVESIIRLMSHLKGKSQFFDGAYEFWSITFYNKPEKIPASWKSFLQSLDIEASDEAIKELSFALETAYSLFSRLIVSKAMDDLEFYKVLNEQPPLDFLLSSITYHRGVTSPIYYSIALLNLTDRMREGYIKSVFEMDIFDWWSDAFQNGSGSIEKLQFEKIKEIVDARFDFSNAVMHVIVQMFMFNFSRLGEDLFGTLYQLYFDKETRKALGEFYTPRSIVDTILDFVSYKSGDKSIINKRFIDPACGSGTFIIEALKRFLSAAEQSGISSEEALDRICNRGLIIGLDVHPFAVQLAQLNFVLHILPHYRKALAENKNFLVKHIPIYRTDSLYHEAQATRRGRKKETTFDDNGMWNLEFGIPLPVKDPTGRFINLVLELPSNDSARDQLNLATEEYFDLLHSFFSTIKYLLASPEVQRGLDAKLSQSDYLVEILTKFGETYLAMQNSKKKADRKLATEKARNAVRESLDKGGKDMKILLERQLQKILALKEFELSDITRNTLINHLVDQPSDLDNEIRRELERSFTRLGSSSTSVETLSSFFFKFAYKILLDARYLRYKFGDGRLIRSIEDRILSILLKHYFKYDVVVANPPYVRIQRVAEYDLKLREHYESVYKTAQGNYDIYIPFIERGLTLLTDEGKLGFICSNRFTTVNYGERIREYIPQNYALRIFIDFRDIQLFEDVLNYAAIMIVDSTKNKKSNVVKACRVYREPASIQEQEALQQLSNALEAVSSIHDYANYSFFDCFGYDQENLNSRGWFLMPPEELKIFNHIAKVGRPLKDYASSTKEDSALFEGSSTGAKEVYTLQLLAEKGKMAIVRSPADDKTYEIERAILKDYVENAGKWVPIPENLVLLFPYEQDEDDDYHVIPKEKLEELDGVWKYLNVHKKTLVNRKDFKDREDWYAYSAPRSLGAYENKKLLVQGFSKRASVSFDKFGYAFGPDIYGFVFKKDMKLEEILILVGILNSAVTDFYVRHVGVIHGDGYTKFEDRFLKGLPVKLTATKILREKILTRVKTLMELSARHFPDYYIERAETIKVGVSAGIFKLSFKKPELTVELNEDENGLKVQDIVLDLDGATMIKLTRNDLITCPSKSYWRFIELYLLTNCESRSGSIRISEQTIKDIFIPKRETTIESAIKKYTQDANMITTLERELDDDIAELYELDSLRVHSKSGKEIIRDYLKRW